MAHLPQAISLLCFLRDHLSLPLITVCVLAFEILLIDLLSLSIVPIYNAYKYFQNVDQKGKVKPLSLADVENLCLLYESKPV